MQPLPRIHAKWKFQHFVSIVQPKVNWLSYQMLSALDLPLPVSAIYHLMPSHYYPPFASPLGQASWLNTFWSAISAPSIILQPLNL